MSVLTHDEIIARVKEKKLIIDPFDQSTVGPASVDLHLGKTFRVFKQVREAFVVSEEADFVSVTQIVTVDSQFLLHPGQVVHAVTLERIVLPANLCGWIEGRSRFGRLGLLVHITASFVHPGTSGFQVLEMNNAGPMPLIISPGIAICQLILEETRGEAVYTGRFRDQKLP